MTIRDQLERLPEPYRTLALKRAKEHSKHSLQYPSKSVWFAVYNAFWKSETPEGYDFWEAVSRWAMIHFDGDLYRLPPIPEE